MMANALTRLIVTGALVDTLSLRATSDILTRPHLRPPGQEQSGLQSKPATSPIFANGSRVTRVPRTSFVVVLVLVPAPPVRSLLLTR